MSTINQIQLPNGSTYDFEDTAAREEVSSKADKTLATASANGLMSAADKTKLDGIDPSAITTNAENIKKNADEIAKLNAATGDSVSEATMNFTSSDVADGSATAWTSVPALASGEKHNAILGKVSQMFKNVRYLFKVLGTTDISGIGDGTATGAISALNADWRDFAYYCSSAIEKQSSATALHVLPLSDIAYAQNPFSITYCNVAIQGKIVLCWLSFDMNNITIPTWTDATFARLKSGYYPAKTKPLHPVGIIQEQTSGLTGALLVVDDAIKINTHNISFNSTGWCWGFIAYVLT